MKNLIIPLLLPFVLSGCLATTTTGLPNPAGGRLDVRLESSPLDKNVKAPTVLLAHGSAGVTNNHREIARTLNSWGYNSVIVDHYTLRGITRHVRKEAPGARSEDRALDIVEAARWVEKQEWHSGKIAVVGFSRGGSAVLTLINEQQMRNLGIVSDSKPNPISVSVAYYPSCYNNPVPSNPSMPTQVHLAEDDDLARPLWCVFSPMHENYSVYRYNGATHAFDETSTPGTVLEFSHRYDRKATNSSREKVKEFLDKHLK